MMGPGKIDTQRKLNIYLVASGFVGEIPAIQIAADPRTTSYVSQNMERAKSEPVRTEFGHIIPPIPSGAVGPSSEIYGNGCTLSLEAVETAARKARLSVKKDHGTLMNYVSCNTSTIM